jgi:Aspartyl protease
MSTWLVDALLDTAADDSVFPESAARSIGIDLSNAPTLSSQGIGGTPLVLRFAQVKLRIADNQEQREWAAWVGFHPTTRRQALLGNTGFLQYFDAIIRTLQEDVELTVNSAYPGT